MLEMAEQDGTLTAIATDGQRYFTLTHAGRKDECYPVKFMFASYGDTSEAERMARALFDWQLEREKAAHPGTILEWRARPELRTETVTSEDGGTTVSLLWMRGRLAFVKSPFQTAVAA